MNRRQLAKQIVQLAKEMAATQSIDAYLEEQGIAKVRLRDRWDLDDGTATVDVPDGTVLHFNPKTRELLGIYKKNSHQLKELYRGKSDYWKGKKAKLTRGEKLKVHNAVKEQLDSVSVRRLVKAALKAHPELTEKQEAVRAYIQSEA